MTLTWTVAWSAFKSFFKKIWVWSKRNWKFVAGLTIPILLWVLTRKSTDLSEVIERISDDYEREISVIDDAHSEKIEANNKALERYRDTLEKVEMSYENSNHELDKKKHSEVKKLLKKHRDDPGEITRKLAELTGFKIHVE